MKLNDVINLDEDSYYEFGTGWIPLVRKMAIEIKDCLEKNYPDAISEFEFTQIKEKFGTLRVYFYPYFDELDNIIDKYEKVSARTCEVCAEPGTLKNDGYWMMTRCEEHSPTGIKTRIPED